MNLKILFAAISLSAVGTQAIAAPAKKADAEQLLEQAREAFDDYAPDRAQSLIEKARAAQKRTRKADFEQRADSLEQIVDRMLSMMQRIEQIEVIDSTVVSTADFFDAIRLSHSAGAIYAADILPEGFDAASPTTVYIPENGRTLMWGGSEGLMECERFTDGTWDAPGEPATQLNRGGVANFPFLMADGITLYYATKADDSLGGYDIYISRRDDSGRFLSPQNVGMPYNSPADDYLLAIDEETGAGWWVTDRNRIPGMVTVYTFIPSELRINYPVDAPDLADRAAMRHWSNTVTDAERAERLRDRIEQVSNSQTDNSPDFELALPDGRVYTRWADFRSAKARTLMEAYVDALEEDAADRRMLEDLRAAYRPGNESARQKIVALEKKTEASAITLKTLSNKVIKAELPNAK